MSQSGRKLPGMPGGPLSRALVRQAGEGRPGPATLPPHFRKKRRSVIRALLTVFFVTFVLGAVLAILVLWIVFRSIAYVPDFYQTRAAIADNQLEPIYDKFVDRVSAIVAELKRKKQTEAVFPEDELNGWLAVQAPRLWTGEAPVQVRQPRLKIGEKKLWLGAEIQARWLKGVVWCELVPEVRGPNVLAVRIDEVRLGRLPLPTDRLARLIVSGYLSETVGPQRATPFWEMGADGRPVLVLQLDPTPDPNSPDRIQIEGLRLGEGAAAVAFRIVRASK